jgi:hypothetical protein
MKLGMNRVLHHTFPFLGKAKDEYITVTGCGVPQGCETSRIQYFLDSQITDGCEVVSLMHRPLFTPPPPPKRFLVLIPSAIVWLEGLSKLKNPMTPSKMKPAIFRLCLCKIPNKCKVKVKVKLSLNRPWRPLGL